MTYVLEPPQQLTLLFARIYNKYMHEKCVHVWLNVCNILHNKLNSCKIQPHFQLEFFIFSVCDVLVLNGYSTSQICWVWLVFFFLFCCVCKRHILFANTENLFGIVQPLVIQRLLFVLWLAIYNSHTLQRHDHVFALIVISSLVLIKVK